MSSLTDPEIEMKTNMINTTKRKQQYKFHAFTTLRLKTLTKYAPNKRTLDVWTERCAVDEDSDTY